MPKPDITRIRRTAAAAVVFDAQGRILLHRRSDNNKWALPGGTMEVGETAEQAVIREVKEEPSHSVRRGKENRCTECPGYLKYPAACGGGS